MKAIVCEEYGPLKSLAYKDVADPVAQGNAVVIRAKAIGVNYPDGLLVQGLYQMKPPTPFIPGMEVAGIIESVGPDVTGLAPGDRVAAARSVGAVPQT